MSSRQSPQTSAVSDTLPRRIWLRWMLSAVAGGALVPLQGCAPKKLKSEKPPPKPAQIFWPAPPDDARYRYEWRLKYISDLHIQNEQERMRDLFSGKSSVDTFAFTRPGGIAARKGLIYVADLQGAGVVVFDVKRRRVFKIGQRDPHLLGKPVAVSLDGAGDLYVLDSKHRKVMIFDEYGLYKSDFSIATLVQPAGLAVNRQGDRICVVDRGSHDGDDHRVYIYDKAGRLQFEIGPRGNAQGQVNIPLDVAVDALGNIYVVDSGNFRVQKFSMDGKFLLAFGSVGRNLGQFARPKSIAVGDDGNIYVGDGVFNNVQIFDAQGQLLMPLGQYGIEDDMPGTYGLLAGLAVDETNRLYVIDQLFNKVEIFRRLE